MADQLRTGTTYTRTTTVTEDLAARHLVGRGIGVLSTPEMVRFVEMCALEGVLPALGPDQETVGIRVDIRHLAGTPVGMQITARCTLVEIDRRRLGFTFEVHDAFDKVAEGTHDRFIVDREKHWARVQEKLLRWKEGRSEKA